MGIRLKMLTIIIPAYNDWPLLRRCLQSIEGHPPSCEHQTFVVVNGSTDETLSELSAQFPWVRVISNAANRRMAPALNQAIAVSEGEFILFLDSDNMMPPGYVDGLMRRVGRDKAVAAACGQRVNPDGSAQSTVHPLPTLWRELAVQCHLLGLVDRFTNQAHRSASSIQAALPIGGLLARRRAIEVVGGFDETFVSGYHDVDLCLRLLAAGFEIWYDPTLPIVHDVFHSAKGDLEYRRVDGLCDMIRYYRKHSGALMAQAALMIHLLLALPNALLYAVLLGSRRSRQNFYRFSLRAELRVVSPVGLRRLGATLSRVQIVGGDSVATTAEGVE